MPGSTLAAGTLFYRAKVAALTPVATKDGKAAAAEKPNSENAHIRGNVKAPVTLESSATSNARPAPVSQGS